ncbi:unnamed protein product [Mytilus edulis]|uniref:Tetraspanin n=1 Tax=Mytilus edulis TaxID=6550 RepID=A0A8S3RJK8_MYTED|nr:unnamed protein product [Mytilus edulis]
MADYKSHLRVLNKESVNLKEKQIEILDILQKITGAVPLGGGIYIIVGFDKMDEKFSPTFDKAKDNIGNMMKVINKYPILRMSNPPNVTMSDPMKDMNYIGFIRACGLFLLVFGTIICAIAVLGLVGTYRRSRRLTLTYVISLSILTLIEIAAVVLFSADRHIVDESYKGFSSNDPVSIGWNVVMQQFNCCGIHGYEDFTSSHSFIEKWAEPHHSYANYYSLNFSLACCNSIEITLNFQGPCRADNYINKRLSQIIVTFYTRIIKSNKPSNKKADPMDAKKYNNVTTSKKDIKLEPKTPVYSQEEMWYPEVQKSNYVSPQKQAWDTGNGDDVLEEKDKWYSGERRKPMKRPNRSLVVDF